MRFFLAAIAILTPVLTACRLADEPVHDTPEPVPPVQTTEHTGDPGPSDDATNEVLENMRRLQKGIQVLAAFPPPEWGEERLKKMAVKLEMGEPLTDREREFLAKIDLWMEAYFYKKSNEKP